MNFFKGSIMVAIFLVLSGCATTPITVSTANITFPVLLGPVSRIGGKPETVKSTPSDTFDINIEHLYTFGGGYGGYDMRHIREGTNKIDAELMMKTTNAEDGVFVTNLFIRSWGYLFIGYEYACSKAGIEGTVHKALFPKKAVDDKSKTDKPK